jgi:hypothetical protein
LFAALAIAGNGAVTSRMAIGHFGDVPYLFLPWWLLGFERAFREPGRGALGAGLWGALCYLEAGIYEIVYGSLIAVLWACAASAARRSARPLAGFTCAMAATLGLAMHVLFPATLFTVAALRREVVPEMVPPSVLGEVFFSTDLDWRRIVFPEQHWRWHEYATFVGPFFALGCILALVRGDRRVWGWAALAAFFVWYGLGDVASGSPWTLLHELPVFRSMRSSGRAFVPAVLCLAVGGALVLDRWRIAPIIVCAFGLHLASVSPVALRSAFTITLPHVRPDPQFSQRVDHRHFRMIFREHQSRMTLDVLRNRGSLACYDPVLPRQHAQVWWPAAEVRLHGSAGDARIAHWSPNRLRIALSGIAGAGHVLVNQNHHRGWRAVDGRQVRDAFGILAVPVRPGDASIDIAFHPPGFFEGLLIALLTLAALAAAAWRSRRRAEPRDSPSAR